MCEGLGLEGDGIVFLISRAPKAGTKAVLGDTQTGSTSVRGQVSRKIQSRNSTAAKTRRMNRSFPGCRHGGEGRVCQGRPKAG